MEFQGRLAANIHAPGGIGFNEWRALRNECGTQSEPNRFVDGELLERFLDMSDTTQETFCDGLGPTAEHMRNIVEELRRLH
jgi:DNA damage-binding protein 1